MWRVLGEGCWDFPSHKGYFFLSQRIFFSLTELTDLTEPICALFRTHRTPPAYRVHRGLTPNPSPNGEGSSMWGYPYWAACTCHRVFSLTELTDLTERFWRTFRSHRRPSAYRIHRTLLLKMGVTFCAICRPQGLCETPCVLFFCVTLWERERTHSMRWHTCNSLGSIFSHRAHRVHRAFWRTVSSPQKAFGIQSSQSIIAKDGCNVLCYLPAARPLWNPVCSVLLCNSVRKRIVLWIKWTGK